MQRIGFVMACTGILTLMACRDAGRAPVFSDEDVRNIMLHDSIVAETDTFATDTFALEPEPVPAAVDELFDDFIFTFDQNKRLQRERVRFPFVIDEEGVTDSIVERSQWQHHHVFMLQDFCTVLWTSARQMLLSQDIDVSRADVEQIYLHSRNVTSFDFERDTVNGHWMLMRERRYNFDQTPLAHFLDFYARFATDSTYQRSHVSNQLRFVSTDEEGIEEPVVGFIDVDQWFEFAPELPRDVLTNIRYGQEYADLRRVIMQMRGISNGLQIELSFVREGDSWRLVGYEN